VSKTIKGPYFIIV